MSGLLIKEIVPIHRMTKSHTLEDPSTQTECFIQISASVQSRDEDDVVAVLKLIFVLAFKLPICVIDQYQDTRPSAGV